MTSSSHFLVVELSIPAGETEASRRGSWEDVQPSEEPMLALGVGEIWVLDVATARGARVRLASASRSRASSSNVSDAK